MTPDEAEQSAALSSCVTQEESTPGCHLVGWWMRPKAGLVVAAERKILSLPGTQTVVQFVCVTLL
jgi:hypothetical protein